MVDTSLDSGGKVGDVCSGSSQEDAAIQKNYDGDRDKQLTKDMLDSIFAQDNPHKQFELFSSQVWLADSARLSTQDKTIAEYDFLNVIFCREQNFTTEQTIAIRGITLSVFKATIVRGELDLDGAFEAFTEQVLSLAEVPETGPGGGAVSGPRGSNNTSSNVPSAVDGGSRASRIEIEGTGPTGSSPEQGLVSGGSGGGGVCQGAGGVVFSVGDIDAITRFVARGLYRNFSLYRMCFKQEARCCREFRQIQVETPLRLLPLHEAEAA